MNEECYEDTKLNAVQQRFLDFYLAQKEIVNELIQDCIVNNKTIHCLERSLNEQLALNQKFMNETKEQSKSLNNNEFNFQYMEANLKRLSKTNSELTLNSERLELEVDQLRNEKESLVKQREAYNDQKNTFEMQKYKIENDLKEISIKVSLLTKERETHLNIIRELNSKEADAVARLSKEKQELEAKLNNKEKEIAQLKASLVNIKERNAVRIQETKEIGKTVSLTAGSGQRQETKEHSSLRESSRHSSRDEYSKNGLDSSRASSKRKSTTKENGDASDSSDKNSNRSKSSRKETTEAKLGFFEISKRNFMKVYDLYNSHYSKNIEKIFLNLPKRDVCKSDLKCAKIKTDKLWTVRYDATKGINRSESKYLLFKYNKQTDIVLKPFETHTKQSEIEHQENFKIINTGGDVTAVDWLANKNIDKHSETRHSKDDFDFNTQFFAYAIKPSTELKEIKLQDYKYSDEERQILEKESENCVNAELEPNLIYVCRYHGLSLKNHSVAELFAIYNERIGHVNCLKWRNEFGVLFKAEKYLNFLGYLLAASSNGNGYIYMVHDLINKSPEENEDECTMIDEIECYIPTFKIVLKRKNFHGECLSADWLQSNGATIIALGYADGTIAIFNIYKCRNIPNTSRVHVIFPTQTIKAHSSAVKVLKWKKYARSKDNIKLITGSTSGLEVWSFENFELLQNPKKTLYDFNKSISDFDLTFYNELVAGFSIDSKQSHDEKNVLRSVHFLESLTTSEKSPFHTNSSITSVNISDYLRKVFVCDSDGSIIMTENPISCNDKDAFRQLAKFISVRDKNDKNNENLYPNPIIIDFNKIKTSEEIIKSPVCDELIKNFDISSVSLSKIKTNPNPLYLDWYLCAGPGFIFLHKINEINLNKINDTLNFRN